MKVEISPHPMCEAIERCLRQLAVEYKRSDFDSGTTYNFLFGETAATVTLPTYVPGRGFNVMRMEFIIGSIGTNMVGRALIVIAADMDQNRHIPLRAAVRHAGRSDSQLLLQFVCPVDGLPESLTSDVLIAGLDLVLFYREMLNQEIQEMRLAS